MAESRFLATLLSLPSSGSQLNDKARFLFGAVECVAIWPSSAMGFTAFHLFDIETGTAQLIHFGGQCLVGLQAGALLVKVGVVQQVVNPQGVDFEQDCDELPIDFDGKGRRRGLIHEQDTVAGGLSFNVGRAFAQTLDDFIRFSDFRYHMVTGRLQSSERLLRTKNDICAQGSEWPDWVGTCQSNGH